MAARVQRLTTTIRTVFDDQHDGGQLAEHVRQGYGWQGEVTRRSASADGCVVAAKQ